MRWAGALARATAIAAALGTLALGGPAGAYPLDGYADTGIERLEAYRLAQTGKIRGRLLPPGARLPGTAIRLRLSALPDFAIPASDPAFDAELSALLGADAPAYAIAILDLSDPANPRLGTHQPDFAQNPGSVGKLVVALAWFQALADLYPGDDATRDALMRDTVVTADGFVRHDSHDVPFWLPGDPAVEYRPIQEGDAANLWTWLDWMLSSSSNAAGSTMMAQLMLLEHFGHAYPVPAADAYRYFRDTPAATLSSRFLEAIRSPVTRNGLDIENLRQGAFFTSEGKARVPGTSSIASPMELLRFLVAMERGALVDAYSSLAMKRLIYLSERRIRYASTPLLRRSAVFFKSGSWYGCQPEKGFTCGKYLGNVRNYMNSVVEVEGQPPERELHYLAVVLSNVLRKNSAVAHRDLATAVHEAIEAFHARSPAPASAAAASAPSGAPPPTTPEP